MSEDPYLAKKVSPIHSVTCPMCDGSGIIDAHQSAEYKCPVRAVLKKVMYALRNDPNIQGREYIPLGIEVNAALAALCPTGGER